MSEKSPFCPLALEEHAPLKTEFLTRSKCLTPKEVESKLSRMLHHPNKGGTSLKVYKLTLGMGSWENTTTFMKSFYEFRVKGDIWWDSPEEVTKNTSAVFLMTGESKTIPTLGAQSLTLLGRESSWELSFA